MAAKLTQEQQKAVLRDTLRQNAYLGVDGKYYSMDDAGNRVQVPLGAKLPSGATVAPLSAKYQAMVDPMAAMLMTLTTSITAMTPAEKTLWQRYVDGHASLEETVAAGIKGGSAFFIDLAKKAGVPDAVLTNPLQSVSDINATIKNIKDSAWAGITLPFTLWNDLKGGTANLLKQVSAEEITAEQALTIATSYASAMQSAAAGRSELTPGTYIGGMISGDNKVSYWGALAVTAMGYVSVALVYVADFVAVLLKALPWDWAKGLAEMVQSWAHATPREAKPLVENLERQSRGNDINIVGEAMALFPKIGGVAGKVAAALAKGGTAIDRDGTQVTIKPADKNSPVPTLVGADGKPITTPATVAAAEKRNAETPMANPVKRVLDIVVNLNAPQAQFEKSGMVGMGALVGGAAVVGVGGYQAVQAVRRGATAVSVAGHEKAAEAAFSRAAASGKTADRLEKALPPKNHPKYAEKAANVAAARAQQARAEAEFQRYSKAAIEKGDFASGWFDKTVTMPDGTTRDMHTRGSVAKAAVPPNHVFGKDGSLLNIFRTPQRVMEFGVRGIGNLVGWGYSQTIGAVVDEVRRVSVRGPETRAQAAEKTATALSEKLNGLQERAKAATAAGKPEVANKIAQEIATTESNLAKATAAAEHHQASAVKRTNNIVSKHGGAEVKWNNATLPGTATEVHIDNHLTNIAGKSLKLTNWFGAEGSLRNIVHTPAKAVRAGVRIIGAPFEWTAHQTMNAGRYFGLVPAIAPAVVTPPPIPAGPAPVPPAPVAAAAAAPPPIPTQPAAAAAPAPAATSAPAPAANAATAASPAATGNTTANASAGSNMPTSGTSTTNGTVTAAPRTQQVSGTRGSSVPPSTATSAGGRGVQNSTAVPQASGPAASPAMATGSGSTSTATTTARAPVAATVAAPAPATTTTFVVSTAPAISQTVSTGTAGVSAGSGTANGVTPPTSSVVVEAPVAAPLPVEPAPMVKPVVVAPVSAAPRPVKISGGKLAGGAAIAFVGPAVQATTVLLNDGSKLEAAKVFGTGLADVALPGVTNGFKNITENNDHQNGWDQWLNGASTATAGTMTGALAVAGGTALAAPVTGGTSLVGTAGSLTVSGVAGVSCLAVGVVHDVTYWTGLSKQGGLLTGLGDMVSNVVHSKAVKRADDWLNDMDAKVEHKMKTIGQKGQSLDTDKDGHVSAQEVRDYLIQAGVNPDQVNSMNAPDLVNTLRDVLYPPKAPKVSSASVVTDPGLAEAIAASTVNGAKTNAKAAGTQMAASNVKMGAVVSGSKFIPTSSDAVLPLLKPAEALASIA